MRGTLLIGLMLLAGCGQLGKDTKLPERDACTDVEVAIEGAELSEHAQSLICAELEGLAYERCEKARMVAVKALDGLRALHYLYCAERSTAAMNPLDVAEMLSEYNVGPLQVARYSPPTRTDYGDFEDSPATIRTLATIAAHTVEGRDLLQVPEADRHKEATKFYTLERLYVGDGGQDVITWGGRLWRVVNVQNYGPQGGVYVSIAVLHDVQITLNVIDEAEDLLPIPEQLAGLAAWMNTRYSPGKSTPIDITLNSGNVSLWVPRAEDGLADYDLTQPNTSLQPLYDPESSGLLNNEPSVGSPGDYLLLAADHRDLYHSGATDWTLFWVGHVTASARLLLTNNNANPNFRGIDILRNANTLRVEIGNGSGTYLFSATTGNVFASPSNWFCVRTRFGNDLRIDYSGGQTSAAQVGAPNAGAASSVALAISTGWKVPYWVLVRRAITDSEVALLAGDANARYGVAL